MARRPRRPRDEAAGSGGSARAGDTFVTGGNGGGASGATLGGGGGRTGSTIDIVYGRRPMKGYPITEGELGQLFSIGLYATICFSLSAGLFGFAVDVSKELAFATGTPQAVVAFWEASRVFSWVLCVVLFGAGIAFFLRGKSILNNIKKSTIF